MKKTLSLCIWGVGPGRPYDNVYVVEKITYKDHFIQLIFDGGEECIIINPVNVIETEQGLRIEKASKIIWKFYCYGKPQSDDSLVMIEYEMVDNHHVQILEKNIFHFDQVIAIAGGIAFDAIFN